MTTITAAAKVRPPLLQYRSLVWNFAQRDLKARFKGTAIGWVWSLLLPIASLLTYTLVAHYILKAKPADFADGRKGNFAVWLFVGLTAWGFFANGLNTAVGGLLGTGVLLKKIYFPSYAPVLGSVIGVAIQSAIEVGLVLVVLLIFGNVGWSWLLVPFWAAIFAVFVSAVSLVLAIANVYFRDLAHIIAVFLQLLFYATPVLYQDSLIANPTAHRILMSNPMSQFVLLFRDLTYGLTAGRWDSWLYILGATAVLVAFSAWVYQRFGRDLGEQL
ncbi:MAG TPA: ABC transporter permease [Jatrophihabitantaceae bacterium]|jgi:ABC-type polysaccharide/polyol phosphate export permease